MPPLGSPARLQSVARVVGAAADQRAVHVDIVQNRGAKEIGSGILAFVKDDLDAGDGFARRDRREGRCRVPPQPEPAVADLLRYRRWGSAADKMKHIIGGGNVEARRAGAAMGTARVAEIERLADVVSAALLFLPIPGCFKNP
jgi:hypothetical protein